MGGALWVRPSVGAASPPRRTGDFRDEDLPFRRVAGRERLETLPFKDLLDVINWIHRTGLESGS
jgi:hypothetical protein